MELLFKLLQIINEIAMWGGPDFAVQPDLALGPLAIAGIAAGAGALFGGANYLAEGKNRRRRRRRANRATRERQESQEGLDQTIQSVLGRAEGIDTTFDDTAEDVYGESIQSLTDRVLGGQAGAGAQLAKATMASGGDITGSSNAMLQRLSEQTNKSLQDIMNEYNKRVDRRNLQREQTNKQLQQGYILNALGAQQNQFSTLAGLESEADLRDIQKRTADKQFVLDSIGLGANVGSMAIGGGG